MGVQEWRVVLEPAAGDVGGTGLASEFPFRFNSPPWGLSACRRVSRIGDWIDTSYPISMRLMRSSSSEDPSVNRLEDTLLLWKAIVGSKLLGKITLIVFLNKCDLLKRKLQSGIMVNKYMISFGNRENEVGTVVKYLKDKFKDILRADTSEPRTTYLYATSVTDTKATATTLNIVRDGIIREHLKHAEFV
ncbi:G-protein alpha subunit-domain-containing protein [Mycena amicta]|nr:G-protein alpha subunit-domain-containing protein [Mycena amicta]